MFIAITLDLSWAPYKGHTSHDWAHLHAALCHIITDTDAELGRQFHDDQRRKLLTISVVEALPQRATVRLTFLTEMGMRYLHILTNYYAKTPVLRIGQYSCHIDAVQTSGTRWTQTASWADLCAPPSGNHFRFELVSPTAIMKLSGFGTRITQLLLEPTDVFNSLVRRWMALGGPSLPEDLAMFLEQHGCVVSDYNLASVKFHIDQRIQIGAVGTITYNCIQPSPIHIAALCQLARFATFSGIGYQTARGMGATITSIQ